MVCGTLSMVCDHYLCNNTLHIGIDIPLLWALNVCLINRNQHQPTHLFNARMALSRGEKHLE
jgi:hypothetical protein